MKKYDDVEIDPENQFGNQKDIKSQLSKIFKKKNYVDWCSIFSKVDACVEPVLTLSESIQHSQLKARKMIVDVPADNGTYKKQIGNPVKFSLSETDYRHNWCTARNSFKRNIIGNRFYWTRIKNIIWPRHC